MADIGFFPDYSEANPYQTELAESLEKNDHTVKMFSEDASISKKAKKEEIDIIHLHWPTKYIKGENILETLAKTFLTTAKLFLLKTKGLNIAWTAHNIESHDKKYPKIEKLFKTVCTSLVFDKVLAHCQTASRKLQKNYSASEQQLEVIEHGNYTDSYPNNKERDKSRQELGIDRNEKVFLCFGQIRRYKGIRELVKQFKNLEHDDVRLLIAGEDADTELASEIEKKASEDSRIEIHDKFIPDKKVQTYMTASDCVILPYKNITTSGTLILAMSFGKPVIAPKKGCIPEHVSSQDSILFESLEKLGESIETSLKSGLLDKGEGNLEKAREMKWSQIAEKTSEIYREL